MGALDGRVVIADVVFDLPLDHPFSYLIPDSLIVTPGQRVSAPLGGRVSRRVPVTVLRGVLAGIIALVMLRVWYDVITH